MRMHTNKSLLAGDENVAKASITVTPIFAVFRMFTWSSVSPNLDGCNAHIPLRAAIKSEKSGS
jgi:hypothetical protein